MKKIRYAVVGTGWITQEAFMPSIAQTGNSQMVAFVTGNPAKAQKLADFHGVKKLYAYDQYDAMLKSGTVDAVYIALPNSMHADYTIRAAKAGVHALVEKPLAVTVAESEAMIAAAAANKVWLMTAYRLHNEPATIEIYDLIRKGAIGDPRLFTSNFSFQSGPDNHRLKAEHWGGPFQDLGVYCVNAARHAFSAEPIEAIAMMSPGDNDARFKEVEATTSATLRFPGGRLAQFNASFGMDIQDTFTVVGCDGLDRGHARLPLRDPAQLPPDPGRQGHGKEVPAPRSFQRPGGVFLRLHLEGPAPRVRRRGGAGGHARAARHRGSRQNGKGAEDLVARETTLDRGIVGALLPARGQAVGAVELGRGLAGRPVEEKFQQARHCDHARGHDQSVIDDASASTSHVSCAATSRFVVTERELPLFAPTGHQLADFTHR